MPHAPTAQGGNAADMSNGSHDGHVKEHEFAQTAHMLKAVECLHAAFVIHRDIKLSNLLLSPGRTSFPKTG